MNAALLHLLGGMAHGSTMIVAYLLCFTDITLGGWAPFIALSAMPVAAYAAGRAAR